MERDVVPPTVASLGRRLAPLVAVAGLLGEVSSAHADRSWSRASCGTGSICDCGRPGTIGHGSGTGTGTRTDVAESLRTRLEGAVASCHPDGARVGLVVETTLEEIVGVDVSMTPATPAVRDCIAEAVWNVALTVRSAPSHATTSLAYLR